MVPIKKSANEIQPTAREVRRLESEVWGREFGDASGRAVCKTRLLTPNKYSKPAFTREGNMALVKTDSFRDIFG